MAARSPFDEGTSAPFLISGACFAQARVDDELGTVVWPNGADLDPLVLHGDFEPASRFVHR